MNSAPEDQIVTSVLDAIAEQRLPAGTKLGEQALSDLFGCNRANVRRAFAALAAQAVVELRPNRGAFVATPPPEEARDVFQARRTIEDTVARHASGKARPEDIDFLRRAIREEREAREQHDKPRELRLSRQFHMRLAEIAGNKVLERFLSELTMRSTLILGLYGTKGRVLCGDEEHGEIVDALGAGDTDRLRALMDRHLRHLEGGLSFDSPPQNHLSLREQLLSG